MVSMDASASIALIGEQNFIVVKTAQEYFCEGRKDP